MTRTFRVAFFGVMSFYLLTINLGFAQSSDRPIRLIVPYAPGGQVDLIARLIAGPLSKNLGQSVVVDNRAGASGLIGMEIALAAAPDGNTLVMASATPMAILPNAKEKRPYDPLKDFAAIGLVSVSPYVLVVQSSTDVRSVSDLIRLAKLKPGALLYGSAGEITGTRLSTELFNTMAGIETGHVPYKGSGPATIDLLGGRLSFLVNNLLPSLPHIKSGKLRALGVTTSKRNRTLPDVPAIGEIVAGYEASAWNGLVAPGRPPENVVRRLNQEIAKVLNMPNVKASFLEQGSDPVGGSSEEFKTYIVAENKKWSGVLKKIKKN